MIVEFVLLFILILLSGFFSSSELAFIMSNNLKIEVKARREKLSAKCAHYFLKKPQMFFSTILISNNIVNIGFASIITLLLSETYKLNNIQILVISSVILLLFGELLPKYLAREYADSFVFKTAIPLRFLNILIYPLAKITTAISNALVKEEAEINDNIVYELDKEDIQDLIDESSKTGQLDQNESDILSKIIDFGDIKVNETMTPRTDIVGVESDATIDDLLQIFIESGYSKIPVYEEGLDNILGVVFIKEMFDTPDSIKSILKPVKFVPETKRAIDMLNQFLQEQISIAIVVDEFGGTEGLVTMEDIIEEMFGDIQDEYDTEDNVSKKIGENAYLFSGKSEIDLINEQFELNIPEGDYETIAGYITSAIGRIPEKSEKIDIDGFKINILRSEKTKVNLVRLYKLN